MEKNLYPAKNSTKALLMEDDDDDCSGIDDYN